MLLKTGISVQAKEGAPDSEGEIEIDQQQLNTAQKLLLFWRKPARKCWWDGVDVVLPVEEGETAPQTETANAVAEAASAAGGGMTPAELELLRTGKGRRTRVWARRVWTLELSLVSQGSSLHNSYSFRSDSTTLSPSSDPHRSKREMSPS